MITRGSTWPRRARRVRRLVFLVVSLTTAWTYAQAADPASERSSAVGTAEPAPPSVLADQEEAKLECFKNHEDAQLARRQSRLLDARSRLLRCSRVSCPAAIRSDCVDWIEEVTRSVPSVVVAARARGRDVVNVGVSIDGKRVAEKLSGAAFEIDPGEHVFRFDCHPWPSVERTILVSEGVKGRALDIEFAPPLPTAIAPPPGLHVRRPALHPANRFDHVVGGIGAASLATSATFGGWALWLRHHYESTCAPFCGDEETGSVRTKFVIADVALGLAVASVVVVYLHLTRPHVPSTNEPPLGIRGAF